MVGPNYRFRRLAVGRLKSPYFLPLLKAVEASRATVGSYLEACRPTNIKQRVSDLRPEWLGRRMGTGVRTVSSGGVLDASLLQ